MDVSILHLSDLHLSKTRKDETDKILNSLIQDVIKKYISLHLGSPYVVISGDLANFGLKDEYNDLVNDFLNNLKDALRRNNLTPRGFIFCPGNHDIFRLPDPLPIASQLFKGLVNSKDAEEQKEANDAVNLWFQSDEAVQMLKKSGEHYYKFAESYHKDFKDYENELHYFFSD